jgi:hypothetical protein
VNVPGNPFTVVREVRKEAPKAEVKKVAKGELPKQLPATGAGLSLAIAALTSAAGAGVAVRAHCL